MLSPVGSFLSRSTSPRPKSATTISTLLSPEQQDLHCLSSIMFTVNNLLRRLQLQLGNQPGGPSCRAKTSSRPRQPSLIPPSPASVLPSAAPPALSATRITAAGGLIFTERVAANPKGDIFLWNYLPAVASIIDSELLTLHLLSKSINTPRANLRAFQAQSDGRKYGNL